MQSVPARTAGTGGGLLNMTRSLGTAFATPPPLGRGSSLGCWPASAGGRTETFTQGL